MLSKPVLVVMSLCLAVGCSNVGSGFAASAGESLSASEAAAVAALQWLDDADPAADAERAMREGRLTLLTLGGRGQSLPGVPVEFQTEALSKCFARLVPGAVDTVLGDSHLAYLQRAYDYAARYNRSMLRVCSVP